MQLFTFMRRWQQLRPVRVVTVQHGISVLPYFSAETSMAILSRRLSSSLTAAAVLAVLAATPSVAQMSPGGARVGPVGGTPSTTAPSNSEGTPAGGTGVIGRTQVGGGGYQASTPDGYTQARPARRVRQARRASQRRSARRARRAAMSRPAASGSDGAYMGGGAGTASSSGLNGSNRPSDAPR